VRIGILSDSHLPGLVRQLDELGPEPGAFFSTVDLILHSGDVTSPTVLDWLEQFAPLLCSTGNNDPISDIRSKDIQMLEKEGWKIGMKHSLVPQSRSMDLLQATFPSKVNIMIAGHTHEEILEYREGVVFMNSGSITFPRHKDLRLGTVGLLDLDTSRLHAEIIVLGHTPGRPNPGLPMALDIPYTA